MTDKEFEHNRPIEQRTCKAMMNSVIAKLRAVASEATAAGHDEFADRLMMASSHIIQARNILEESKPHER